MQLQVRTHTQREVIMEAALYLKINQILLTYIFNI